MPADSGNMMLAICAREWKSGQNAEDGVFGADVDDLEDAFGLGVEIAVREHHALGIAGGARGVENHRDVVRVTARAGSRRDRR